MTTFAGSIKPHMGGSIRAVSDTDKWRKLDTLMHVIGADEETAKRLLLEVGARASEDGQTLWGLKKFHPFKEK